MLLYVMKTIKLDECKLRCGTALVWRLDDGSDHRDFMNNGKPGSIQHREFEVTYEDCEAIVIVKSGDDFPDISYSISTIHGVHGIDDLIYHVGEDNHSFEFRTLESGILVTVSATKMHYAPGGPRRYLVAKGFSVIHLSGLDLDWEHLEIEPI